MWIARNSSWNSAAKPLEKFFIERILQRCDYSEIISNKYRTTNGYTLLKEIIHYCEVTLRRSKTVKTLIIALEEAKCPLIYHNIVNDFIVQTYFIDLKEYIENNSNTSKLVIDKMQPNLVILENLYKDLRVFEKQLDKRYFDCLTKELREIPYQEEIQIARYTDKLSNLIDLLIPYLIFNGYSNATISEILRSWLKRGYHITIPKFLSFFHFNDRPFSFLQYLGENTEESDDFLRLMGESVKVSIEEIQAIELSTEFLEQNKIPNKGKFAKYQYSTQDPHKHVRSSFDSLLKDLVTQKERQSLAVFNGFFKHSFWSNRIENPFEKYRKISLEGDPINVEDRGKTLRNTLYKSSKIYNFEFQEDQHIPLVECIQLRNSIYYYNLALGSKSIENSLSLLWTSLEAIQPYKIYGSDIEAVQKIVSISLGLGSVGRDIFGFVNRLNQFDSLHSNCFTDKFINPTPKSYYPDDMLKWFEWIRNKDNCQDNFNQLKMFSELLAFQYLSLGKNFDSKNLNFIEERIIRSESSIKFQLQRIYHHRNKIVHSGDLINEYTNLWMHLEWYVGKILAYFIIMIHFKKRSKSLEDSFLEIEADRHYLVSYLQKNKDKPIREIPNRITELIFKHNWQVF